MLPLFVFLSLLKKSGQEPEPQVLNNALTKKPSSLRVSLSTTCKVEHILSGFYQNLHHKNIIFKSNIKLPDNACS